MSETLKIINNLSLTSQGSTTVVKQGAATGLAVTPFEITVDGKVHQVKATLATASVVTIWDEDDDTPGNFVYFAFWGDQDCYLQFIGSATNFVIRVGAKQPFVLTGFDELLAAANTTAITGGTEPTMEDIDSVILGNYSGSTINYNCAIVF